ncbi:ABC transporter ATP-binding protein [Acetonema longum]|uniref:ABC transporter n=1 Tax=Acetonema longum DSM 6540 TaxID=1009370 RepID=F7NJ33_9FIRM|nr:ATP-binding cassette domain-containing protein [Acetonema longum]EGO63923.1 ABC transporter [Acetonema longum DSM 6540]
MLLEAKNISYRYRQGPWILKEVTLSVGEGEQVGLVGPSGYGKSTLSRILAGYIKPASGEVLLDGRELPTEGHSPVQLIYQHPEKAINPLWRMKDILNEGWVPDQRILDSMGIEPGWLERWPSELSGGELQRFCIARVLGPKTRFLIADEMSTMLDVITQAQIWELMLRIVEERRMGLIVVTHNKALAQNVCTRIISLPELNKLNTNAGFPQNEE